MPSTFWTRLAILIPCRKEQWCYSERTFGEIYAERTMTRAEVEHAVSMFFNDVRLKTYIEIRPADAMPVPYVVAYAALIKGLFYHAENLDALDGLFEGVDGAAVEAARMRLWPRIRGRGIRKTCGRAGRRIVKTRTAGPCSWRAGLPRPLAQLAARRVTLADLAERKETGVRISKPREQRDGGTTFQHASGIHEERRPTARW